VAHRIAQWEEDEGVRGPKEAVEVSESERERRLRELIDIESTLGTTNEEFVRLALWAINLLAVTRARLGDTQESLAKSGLACEKAEKLLSEESAVIWLMRSEHDSLVAEHASALERTVAELASARTEIVMARTVIADLEEELAAAHQVVQTKVDGIAADDDAPPPDPGQGGDDLPGLQPFSP
jgi:hypothetical protein